jgi:hypothetical protein
MLRQSSQSRVNLRRTRRRWLPLEPSSSSSGTVPRQLTRVVVQKLNDGVAPDRLEGLPLVQEVISQRGSSSRVQPDQSGHPASRPHPCCPGYLFRTGTVLNKRTRIRRSLQPGAHRAIHVPLRRASRGLYRPLKASSASTHRPPAQPDPRASKLVMPVRSRSPAPSDGFEAPLSNSEVRHVRTVGVLIFESGRSPMYGEIWLRRSCRRARPCRRRARRRHGGRHPPPDGGAGPGAPGRAGRSRPLRHARPAAGVRNRSGRDGGRSDPAAALTRLFDFYLTAASDAMNGQAPSDRSWLDAERANLIALAAHGATTEWAHHTVALSRTLFWYLNGGGTTPTRWPSTITPITPPPGRSLPSTWAARAATVQPRIPAAVLPESAAMKETWSNSGSTRRNRKQ